MLHRCNSRLHSHIRTTHVKLNEKDELYNNECTEQRSKDDVTNEACGEDIKRKNLFWTRGRWTTLVHCCWVGSVEMVPPFQSVSGAREDCARKGGGAAIYICPSPKSLCVVFLLCC